jgi:hypothetical protein
MDKILQMPNQVAARNSRERLSIVASGFLITPFTFVAGAHPAVREFFRSAAPPATSQNDEKV